MNEVNKKNIRRYEILSLNQEGFSVYMNPHDSHVEPIEDYLVLYRRRDDVSLQTIHPKNRNTSVLLALGNRKVFALYTDDPEISLNTADLVLSDVPSNAFDGQMIIFVKFDHVGFAIWFVDTTVDPAAVTSIWSNHA